MGFLDGIEAAACLLEESAQALSRQHDPGMANHDRALAARVRQLRPKRRERAAGGTRHESFQHTPNAR
jgi:hypothetical protein